MGSFKIDADAVRLLANLINETGLGEIEYEEGDRRIRVAMPQSSAAPIVAAPIASAATPAQMPDREEKPSGAVTSPMVGTVYLQSGPGEPPFIKIGDKVNAGDVVIIIEAMKVMNQIPAPHGGIVRSIDVADAQAVEFGEVLMVIE
ncbi:MAG: biotin/lipoyl-containing protein [Rhodospirillales bacterium]